MGGNAIEESHKRYETAKAKVTELKARQADIIRRLGELEKNIPLLLQGLEVAKTEGKNLCVKTID